MAPCPTCHEPQAPMNCDYCPLSFCEDCLDELEYHCLMTHYEPFTSIAKVQSSPFNFPKTFRDSQ